MPTSGGASSYCPPGVLHCETFEDFPNGPAVAQGPWMASVNGEGTLVIDEQIAHAGKRSLRVHGSGFSTFLVLSLGALPVSAKLHVRAFMRLEQAMTSGHNTFIVLDTKAAPGAGNALRLGEMNEMLMYTVSGDTHGALANEKYYTDHLPGAALQASGWGCLELSLDTSANEISVALDGKDVPDLHHTDFPLDAYDALRFGFEKYAGPVSDVWYDDVAVATAPIGCGGTGL
jgi:hypothetical protein